MGYAIGAGRHRIHTGIELGPGTLYSAISRLVENGGWIEPE